MRISDGSSDVCSSDLTSVPGVAQRTGATIYYLERIPEDLVARAGRPPVLAMMPTPGDVNLVLAAELMEGGRAIGRGLVTPDRTTLITSSHRSYAISEKSAPGTAIPDPNDVLDAGRHTANRAQKSDVPGRTESVLVDLGGRRS